MPIGFHVSKNVGNKKRSMQVAISEGMETLASYGFKDTCAQIFVSGPQNFKENITEEDQLHIRKFLQSTGIPLVIHGAYVDNPWNKSRGSVHNIKREMAVAANLGATGVIVHLGAGAYCDENLKYVLGELADQPQSVLDSTTLWLEIHTARQSEKTYETPEKLHRLVERIRGLGLRLKVGLCIDTAHLYSCGMVLDTYQAAQEWIRGLPDIPLMLHLNDSGSTFNSGIDRHAGLTVGNIWKAYNTNGGGIPIQESGLFALLEWADSAGVVTILERDMESLPADLGLIYELGFFRV